MSFFSRPAKLVAGLVFVLALVPLGAVAYAVLSLRCCGAAGQSEPAAWIVVGVVVLAVAAAVAVFAGGLTEIMRRLFGRPRKGS